MQGESKAAKFERLAQKRTEAILESIRKLANLGNARAYEFTPQQIDLIFDTIEERVKLARKRFEAELKFSGYNREHFKLGGGDGQ